MSTLRKTIDDLIVWPLACWICAFVYVHWHIATDRQHWGLFVRKWMDGWSGLPDRSGMILDGDQYAWMLYSAYVVMGVIVVCMTMYYDRIVRWME